MLLCLLLRSNNVRLPRMMIKNLFSLEVSLSLFGFIFLINNIIHAMFRSGFSPVNYPKVVPLALADHVERNFLQGKMQFGIYRCFV